MKKIIGLRNVIRVVGLGAALVFALSGGAGLAKASIDISGGNDTTGPNSENENEWDIESEIEVDISNEASVDNDQEFEVGTGDLDIDNNTTVDDISTGDVSGQIEIENLLNTGDIELMSLDPGDIEIELANDTTGPNSENENEVSIEVEQDIDIENEAEIDNDLELEINTGDNDVDHNTVVGDISTGDIDFNVSVRNEANSTMGNVDLTGLGGVDVSADLTNGTTGPYSENENEVNIELETEVDIENSATIENDTEVEASTGDNDIDHNTVVGDISTGSVNIDFTTTNVAN